MTLFHRLGLRGVMFDMDGLLFDTEALYLETWPQIGEAMGFPITIDDALITIGRPNLDCEPAFQKLFGPDFSMQEAQVIMEKLVRAKLEAEGVPIKPGARELLEFLHGERIPMALGTSNVHRVATAYLEATGFDKYFGPIVTGDMVEHPKPAPDIFQKAAAELGLLPNQCVVFEDSPAGILSAYKAGCLAAMVPDLLRPGIDTLNYVWRVFDNLDTAAETVFANRLF